MSGHVHHGFDYIEIPTNDIDASEAFYRSAFGWAFNAYGPGYLGIVTADGREAGGISLSGEPTRGGGGPLVVLFSDDLDATHDAVIAAGGAITHETFVFPGGRRFHFTDPTGNELGVWGDPSD